jgi:hypothetical protein
LIELIEESGVPVRVEGNELIVTGESDFWKLLTTYGLIDALGRCLQARGGTQYITRESRATGYKGLTIGEIDCVTAFLQFLLGAVSMFLTDDHELKLNFPQLFRYDKASQEFKAKVATYYEIKEEDAKNIFVRFPCGGSILPDEEWEPRHDRARDVLPCLLQLRHEVRQAHALLAEKSERYQQILGLPRVQASDNKDMSALAIFLMDAETKVMTEVKDAVVASGGNVVSVVYDGLYVLAKNSEDLLHIYDNTAKQIYKDLGIKLALKAVDGSSIKKFGLE